jgi:hypothetical protein
MSFAIIEVLESIIRRNRTRWLTLKVGDWTPIDEITFVVAGYRARLATVLVLNFHFAMSILFQSTYLNNDFGLPVVGGLSVLEIGVGRGGWFTVPGRVGRRGWLRVRSHRVR